MTNTQPATEQPTSKDTYTSDNNHDGKPDVIPPLVRTITYYGGSILNAVIIILSAVAVLCHWTTEQVGVMTAVMAAYNEWANSVGAAYNPGTEFKQ